MKTKKTKKSKWTDRDLLHEFRRLNARHFGNKLKVLYVRFEEMEHLGHTKAYRSLSKKRSEDTYGIRISEQTRSMRRVWRGSLIHEMVHVEQRNKFSCAVGGYRFNRRMKELAAAGAFIGIW